MGTTATYTLFPTLVPTSSDMAVGALTTANNFVCRRDIWRLGLKWEDMKYITDSRAKMYIYNCSICGNRLTKKRAINNL